MINGLKLALAAMLLSAPAAALAASEILVHRDPGCSCCAKWAAQVKASFGRAVRIIDDPARPALQRKVGLPAALTSCHTAIIDGYVFEGHVPIADIKRLLAAHPKGVTGLAVAGMPMGSPGMELPGMAGQHFVVMAFGTSGQRVFARH